MPAIKKRITAEYLEREQQRGSEQNGRGAGDMDEENLPPAPPPAPLLGSSPLKRKAPTGAHLLKGLDGEVLVEKRKRTLPPAELKLDAWLDENLEKKAESTLSVMKLYQFYTDMCQQDATNVVEMEVLRHMLKNKFGKEFGLKDNSPYMGLLKESKPRKKPVVAPSLGYKMKDLIQEALKASGNPMKGVMFAWVKKFIAGKYPALQIELRPHFLRSALEREIYAGKVELVKGIGFCGFYRLPGPPDVEEDPAKAKKKGGKKPAKGEEGVESADDSGDKEGEESDKSQEKTEDSAAEQSDDKQKKEGEESVDDTEEGKDAKGDDKKEDKKAKKKKKRPAKPRRRDGPRHGHPQTINDVFPLAMTYMAEPKEASFGRIRKYLEKYYGKTDIDVKLKKCMEHGCDTGMWDRVSGSGASGSFQLQVDSFNPEHTESLTDMVCSAIIACTEPKVSSVRLLKSYICEYHPEFNIDTRPVKLRNALERAEKYNQLRRISGIGMSGSFQLVEQFTPSPAVLAGEEDEEQEEEGDAGDPGAGKEEVYVVRQTKSGRRAPIDRTQLDFSSSYKKKSPAASAARSKTSNSRRQPTAKKGRQAQESSEEEEEEESSEEEEEEKSYTPRPTKSRGRSAPPPKKSAAKPPPAKSRSREGSRGSSRAESAPAPAKKARQPAAKSPRRPPPAEMTKTEVKKANAVSRSPPILAKKSAPAPNPPVKRARPSRAAQPEEEDDEEDEKLLPAKRMPTKRARSSRAVEPEEDEEEDEKVAAAKRTSAKRAPAKRARPTRAPEPEEEEEENYYEVEEASPPAKRGGAGHAVEGKETASAKRAPAKRPRPSRIDEEDEEDDFEIEEEETTPPPKRGGGGRAGGAKGKSTAGSPRRGGRKVEVTPSPVAEARTPRSASRSARQSLKEVDSDDEFDDDDEYVARPTQSRGGKKR